YLSVDPGGLVVPGGNPRSVLAPRGRLVAQRTARTRHRAGRPEDGTARPSIAAGSVASLGSRQPVRQPRVSAAAGGTRHPKQHEPEGQLLGQRGGRKFFRHAQNRTGLSEPVEYPNSGTQRAVRVHRAVLQPPAATFSPRLLVSQ